ncbi:MAG: DUF3501 family protein [Rhodospirillales bacterium]
MSKRTITREDILDLDAYERVRDERRRQVTTLKRDRRVAVGPDATFYFENYDTMWHQIHEMLRIEKGGEAQIEDEIGAYAPLVPKGRELVATLMIEIDDPVRRARTLSALGGVENEVTLAVGGETIVAVPEGDVERTTAAGKTSSIHFLRFPFTAAQIAAFRRAGTRVVLAVAHPAYDHAAALPEPVRAALAADFD